jgi:hypothetical protein
MLRIRRERPRGRTSPAINSRRRVSSPAMPRAGELGMGLDDTVRWSSSAGRPGGCSRHRALALVLPLAHEHWQESSIAALTLT